MNKNIINFLTDFQFRTVVSRLSWALGAWLEILWGQLFKTNHVIKKVLGSRKINIFEHGAFIFDEKILFLKPLILSSVKFNEELKFLVT